MHQIRNSLRYVTWQDRKRVVPDLKPIYQAVNAEAAERALDAFDQTWGAKYPMIALPVALYPSSGTSASTSDAGLERSTHGCGPPKRFKLWSDGLLEREPGLFHPLAVGPLVLKVVRRGR